MTTQCRLRRTSDTVRKSTKTFSKHIVNLRRFVPEHHGHGDWQQACGWHDEKKENTRAIEEQMAEGNL